MELKEFIKTAITDISDAISELQEELGEETVVNPAMPNPVSLKTITVDGSNRLISILDFDVALTVGNTDSVSGNTKAGIQILSAKMSGDSKNYTENVSRLKFSVQVALPAVKIITDEEAAIDQMQSAVRAQRRACD